MLPTASMGPERSVVWDTLVSLYQSGLSQTEVARRVGLKSRRAVAKALKLAGVEPRPHYLCCRQTNVVDDAFVEVTPKSAYNAGLLATDGCIIHPRNESANPQVCIELSSIDADIVEQVAAFLGGVTRLFEKDGRGYIKVSVSSAKMVEDLRRLGITERKTKTLRIESSQLVKSRDFWRGCLDGDGCIGKKQVYLCGASLPFLEQFRDYVADVLNKNIEVRETASGSMFYQVRLSTANAAALLQNLYQDGDVAMQRKVTKATEFVRRWGK